MGSRGNNGGVAIPEASRKIVRSLKEVVGCPEAEIYAMLKECNMDPNEAVNRLLSQDPFHEVKSKKEKKKENKYSTESRPRGTNNYSSHYVGRSGTQFSSSESGTSYGKPAYKKENGSAVYGSHSSGTTGNNVYHQPPVHSDPIAVENKDILIDTADGGWGALPSSGFSQPSSGNPPVWGQVSMADIVKKGRPQAKPSTTANQTRSNSSYHDVNSSKVSPDDEWPLVEPSARIFTVVEPPSDWHPDTSHLSSNAIDQHHPEPEYEDVPDVEHASVENTTANDGGYNNSEIASHFNNDVYENTESYQHHVDTFEHHADTFEHHADTFEHQADTFEHHADTFEHREVEDVGISVSSVTSNLQQLKVVDEPEASPEEEDAAVIIPNHLQVQSEECLHLSFGSFGSFNAAPVSTKPTISNTDEASVDEDDPSVGHLDSRNSEYYGDETLRTGSDGNLVHRTATSGATAYDLPSGSQSEVLNQENHERPHENQYNFPSSSNYSFDNGPQLNASFAPSQTSAQMQTFSNQAYGNTLSSSLLGASAQSARESDYSYSPFAMGQSIPAKYGNTVSPVSSSSVSMPEVLKAAGFASSQLTPQNITGSNIPTGPALPQHLIHQYSQLSPFANLIGYPPFLPPSYYMPGAYQQQAFAGNNAYHQSLGAMPPQYKNSSTSLPGNFPTNQPSGPGGAAVGYEDVLSAQYKDASHLLSLQQNENQAVWIPGHGSRTMQGVPANTYYNYQAQSQQQQQQQQPPSGFRQNQQQLSQNYNSLGNSNFYHSQTGAILDHQQQQQQQNPRDGSQVQGGGNKQTQQLWQNSY